MSYPHRCQIWWHRPAPRQYIVSVETPTAGSSVPSPRSILGSAGWMHGPGGCRVKMWRTCQSEGISPPDSILFTPHLCLEAFHQDGYQQVEEHVVPKGHEGHKVKGSPGRGGSHAVVKNHVPVFLCQDLQGHVCRARNGSGPTRFSVYLPGDRARGLHSSLAPWSFGFGCPRDRHGWGVAVPETP